MQRSREDRGLGLGFLFLNSLAPSQSYFKRQPSICFEILLSLLYVQNFNFDPLILFITLMVTIICLFFCFWSLWLTLFEKSNQLIGFLVSLIFFFFGWSQKFCQRWSSLIKQEIDIKSVTLRHCLVTKSQLISQVYVWMDHKLAY